jgi:filamentous hemagglutinin
MAQEIINVGTAPNDGLGDPIRTAYIKCNDNFGELYSRAQENPPTTLVGTIGDQAGMYAYDTNYFYYCYQDYDGSSIIWAQISEIGNVSVSVIQNGTSNVLIGDISGNPAVSVNGVSNVAVFTTTGVTVTANVAAANVNATNIYGLVSTAAQPSITSVGTLSSLNVTANVTGGNLVTAGQAVVTGNVSGGNIVTVGTVAATGNVTGGNIISTNDITASANIYALDEIFATGNITTTGVFVGTFQGNITGNFVVPGSNTQVLFNTTGNADASSAFTFNKDSNVLTLSGNIASGNISTTGIIVGTGNVTGGNITTAGRVVATGNVTGGNITTSGLISASTTITAAGNVAGGNVIATANVTGGNILTTGIISASGNITGGNVIGGGLVAISNISGGNASLSGALTVTGNIAGGNIATAGIFSALSLSATGNITGGNLISLADTNTVRLTATGNVTGGNIITAGIASITGNITGGNISLGGQASVSGNVTGGNLITGGRVTATGNVTGANIVATTGIFSTTVAATGNVTGGNIITTGLGSFGTTVTATGNVTGGNLITAGSITVNSVNAATAIVNGGANAVGNIGSPTRYFNTVHAVATSAQYADLAECYVSDAEYAPGTVVVFGGINEITVATKDADTAVAGVISTNPAYRMNSGLKGEFIATVALVGRVPCQVQGPVTKGALMVSAGNGRARAAVRPEIGTVIGKAVETFDGDIGTIEIVVGRL